MNSTFVLERIKLHYNTALRFAMNNYCELIGVFIKGSQNYNLDSATSDVDTVAFIVPSEDALLFNKPISAELHIEDEHCLVKDIRFIYKECKKGSPNLLEIFFSKYYKLNPKYKDAWNRMIADREVFSRINPEQTIKAMCGLSLNTKKHYHQSRILEMVNRYINNEPFEDILVSRDLEKLREIKKNNLYNEEVVETIKEISKQEFNFEYNAETDTLLRKRVRDFFNVRD